MGAPDSSGSAATPCGDGVLDEPASEGKGSKVLEGPAPEEKSFKVLDGPTSREKGSKVLDEPASGIKGSDDAHLIDGRKWCMRLHVLEVASRDAR